MPVCGRQYYAGTQRQDRQRHGGASPTGRWFYPGSSGYAGHGRAPGLRVCSATAGYRPEPDIYRPWNEGHGHAYRRGGLVFHSRRPVLMAAGCCFLWCMRYNPSQATRLLLDPLISDDSAKFLTDFGGFVHSGSGNSPSPAPERLSGHAPVHVPASGSPHFFRITFCHLPASPQSRPK